MIRITPLLILPTSSFPLHSSHFILPLILSSLPLAPSSPFLSSCHPHVAPSQGLDRSHPQTHHSNSHQSSGLVALHDSFRSPASSPRCHLRHRSDTRLPGRSRR